MGQTLRVEQQQTQVQRLMLILKLSRVEPRGLCPECGYEMTDVEIHAGWSSDPKDFTTQCPDCEHRFVAKLAVRVYDIEGQLVSGDEEVFDYLCRDQLLHELSDMQTKEDRSVLGIGFLKKHYPGLLWNMRQHFKYYAHALAAYKAWRATRS